MSCLSLCCCNNVFPPSPTMSADIDFSIMMASAIIAEREDIKQKGFCPTKETSNKAKMQPTEWEKIFANHISTKIKKKFTQLNSKKIKKSTQFKNGQRT